MGILGTQHSKQRRFKRPVEACIRHVFTKARRGGRIQLAAAQDREQEEMVRWKEVTDWDTEDRCDSLACFGEAE